MKRLLLIALFCCLAFQAQATCGARGFSATGGGTTTTDNVTVANFAWPAQKYSISAWTYFSATATENLADRLYDNGTGGLNTSTYNPSTTTFTFVQSWSTTNGNWAKVTDLRGAWHNIVITYDGGNVANQPSVYLDGASQALSETSTPVGTYTAGTQSFYLGNNAPSGGIRVWNGKIADFALWSGRLLTANDATALSKGASPLKIGGAAPTLFYALCGDQATERGWGSTKTIGTVLGALKQAGPPTQAYPLQWITGF